MRIKKLLKNLIIIILMLVAISISSKVYANNIVDIIEPIEYTQKYQEWLELEETDKEGLIEPRMYEIPKAIIEYTNPLRITRMLRTTVAKPYTLMDYIPENIIVKNQLNTNLCWAFAALGQLETNLALKNYYAGKAPKVYDFSERHMEYATSRTFLNDYINEESFYREVGSGGNYIISTAYLTNGSGAVNESDLPFEDNEQKIEIEEIQGATVTAYVKDTIEFPEYIVGTDDIEEIKTQMKDHIKNYGGIITSIHGASLYSEYYNNETGAIYCDDVEKCKIDHSVVIIGWDDNYGIENFNESHRPQAAGAWIIKNSWGTEEQGTGTKIGIDGLMYISYEDVNVYTQQTGLINASDKIEYDNLYQYNNLGRSSLFTTKSSINTVYIGTKFTKQTLETEYITEVSLNIAETTTCKVYYGADLSNLDEVELKAGKTETLLAGYHTLEFLNPLEIETSEFVIVVEMTGTGETITFPLEKKSTSTSSVFYNIETETDKCFLHTSLDSESDWIDLGVTFNADSTIKVFTVSEIKDTSLKSIEITTPPDKTEYITGEDFDKTGMTVTAYYNDNTSWEIIGYNITNGSNLTEEQSSVLITYQDKTVEQPIIVKSNEVEEDIIEKPNPVNSNFGQIITNIENVKAYFYTDTTKTEYVVIDVIIDGIKRSDVNDCFEYYYYLSPNQQESRIESWVKISQNQDTESKLTFTINTTDISNYKQLSDAEQLYLYIKEIAIREGEQNSIITDSIKLELKTEVEKYIDDVKIVEDNTTATQPLPNAGNQMLKMLFAIIMISVTGTICYKRYQNIDR